MWQHIVLSSFYVTQPNVNIYVTVIWYVTVTATPSRSCWTISSWALRPTLRRNVSIDFEVHLSIRSGLASWLRYRCTYDSS